MKRFYLLLAVCLTTALCFAQPPRGGEHHPGPDHGYNHDRHHHDHDHDHHHDNHQPVQVTCASSEEMRAVMKVLKDQSFDDKKLEVAKMCAVIGRFCTSDFAEMAETFNFDDKRLEFLKFAYQYCLDPQNYPMLHDCFTFESNYDALMKYVLPAPPKKR